MLTSAPLVSSQEPRKVLLSWIPASMARGRDDYESFLRAERSEPSGAAGADDGELASPLPPHLDCLRVFGRGTTDMSHE